MTGFRREYRHKRRFMCCTQNKKQSDVFIYQSSTGCTIQNLIYSCRHKVLCELSFQDRSRVKTLWSLCPLRACECLCLQFFLIQMREDYRTVYQCVFGISCRVIFDNDRVLTKITAFSNRLFAKCQQGSLFLVRM